MSSHKWFETKISPQGLIKTNTHTHAVNKLDSVHLSPKFYKPTEGNEVIQWEAQPVSESHSGL